METLGLISELLNQNLHRKRSSGDSYALCWRMSAPENRGVLKLKQESAPSLRPCLTLARTQVVSAGCLLLSRRLSPCLVLTASVLSASPALTHPWCLSSSSVLPKSLSFPGRPPWASVLQQMPKPQRALSPTAPGVWRVTTKQVKDYRTDVLSSPQMTPEGCFH